MIELLVLAVIPAILLIWYIYRKDRYEPEPKYLVAQVFLLGALSTIPAILLELPFPEGLFSVAVVAPVVEEGLKFLVVYLTVYKNTEFDEPIDGIVYAAAAGLGFATVENIFYVLDGGLEVALVRGVLSVPGHVLFSCIWGFALGIAKFRPESERKPIIIMGLIGAMALHGLFNFSLDFFEVFGLVIVILVISPLGWWILHRNIRRAHEHPDSAFTRINKTEVGSQPGAAPGTSAERVGANAQVPDTGVPSTAGPDETLHVQSGPGGYCTECGFPCSEGAKFCGRCGKQLHGPPG